MRRHSLLAALLAVSAGAALAQSAPSYLSNPSTGTAFNGSLTGNLHVTGTSTLDGNTTVGTSGANQTSINGTVSLLNGPLQIFAGNSLQLKDAGNNFYFNVLNDGTNVNINGPVTATAYKVGSTTVLNTSGVLQAVSFPALTGDVTTSAGALGTTIAANAVTYAKVQSVTASRLLGNPTGSGAVPSEISLAGGLAFSGTTLTAAGALTPTSVASTGIITSTGAGGIGYATGAGGAVTQITSRTTGVTDNVPCGAITLVSAAGSATWATFTVTDSRVAATDTIVLSQKTGANLYNVIVTAVAAGSFNISVSAVSGTATEAPVINFADFKAVAA